MLINDKNDIECKPCPSNCSSCYLILNDEIACSTCEKNFFLNPKTKTCEICAENCQECIGPELIQCIELEPGFFYNESSNRLNKCKDEGCMNCSTEDKCHSCKKSFFAQKIESAEKTELVKCLNCELDHCLFCSEKEDQVEGLKFMTCKMCEKEYGLISGSCQKCTENCEFCSEEAGKCTLCAQGYRIEEETGTCVSFKIPHCFSIDKEGKCRHCETTFFLQNNKCIPCEEEIDNCKYCRGKDEDLSCIQCKTGFFENQDKCLACSKSCNQCDEKGCIICEDGYFLEENTRKCKKCEIEKCSSCNSEDLCQQCYPGLYFNEIKKICEPCKENCLECSIDGTKCFSCPINLFTLEEKVKTSQKGIKDASLLPNILANIFGGLLKDNNFLVTEIHLEKKCVKKCPDKLDGNKVYIDYSRRMCFVSLGDEPLTILEPDKEDEEKDVLSVITQMYEKYQEDIQDIKNSALQDDGTNQGNQECLFHGKLNKEVTGNSQSYYICHCFEGYLGDNCQISQSTFEQTQKNLAKILKRLEKDFVNHDKHQQKILLKALSLMGKFKLGKPILENIMFILESTLSHNKEMDNQEQLYIVYDNIILNLFDLLEDQKKQKFVNKYDIKIIEQKKELYSIVNKVVNMIEYSLEDLDYAESFLKQNNEKYLSFNTFSFVMNEFQLKDLVEKKQFEVRNPDIDTASEIDLPSEIKFQFLPGFDQSNQYNIQIINFASILFANKLEELFDIAISNFIYLKNIDPTNPTKLITSQETRMEKVIIKFPLLFIPSNEISDQKIQCKAYSFDPKKTNRYGIIEKVDDDNLTVSCVFDIEFEFNNYYFGVSYTKQLNYNICTFFSKIQKSIIPKIITIKLQSPFLYNSLVQKKSSDLLALLVFEITSF